MKTYFYFLLLLYSIEVASSNATAEGGILIIPLPIFSPLYKSACLARELRERGYNVTVVLPDGSVKQTLLEEFDFEVIVSEGMTKALRIMDDIYSDIVQYAFSGSKMELLKLLKFREICYSIGEDEKLVKTLQERNFKIAIINTVITNLCTSVIPYRLGIPFIREEAQPLASGILIHPAVFPVNMFLPTTDKMTYFQRLANTLFYGVYLLKPDIFNPSDIVGKFAPEREHITNAELHAMTELYLLDYDELVEYHLPVYPNMIPIGGMATRPPGPLSDGELKEYMDSAHYGAVIISFGSIINWIPSETRDKLVSAFHHFPHLKFVFKYGRETRKDGNVMFVSWIPQNDLLGHQNTKLFMTHCGLNAQYEALYNAVPVIALPINGDQSYNAMAIQAKGFGIELDILQISEDDVISAINEIMNNTTFKENISKASKIFKSRSFTPAQRAAWWIEHVIKYTWYKQTLFTRHGIKQKPTLFLLGDLLLVAKEDMNYINADLIKKNGKVFGYYLCNFPSLIVADTDMLKQIMVKDFSKFTDRKEMIPISEVWKSSVTDAQGEHWKFLRTTLTPTFTTGKMRNMSVYINKCLNNFMEILDEKQQGQGDGFDITPVIRGYTMDVICSTGFGLDVNSQRDPNNSFVEHAKGFLEIGVADNPLFILSFLFPDLFEMATKVFNLGIQAVSQKSFDFFQTATRTAIDDRRKDTSKHNDLLQLMINSHKGGETKDGSQDDNTYNGDLKFDQYKKRGLTDQEVLINSMMFMVAGYDTTATTLCWLTYDLATNPDVQEKLIEEIDSEIGQEPANYDNAFKLKYLDMIVQETLRVHPPAVVTVREPNEDVEVCGIKLKKGWNVTIPILALHFMPEYWKEPTKYNPERFAPENQADLNPYAYMPFGTGPRNCIGMRLALFEVKVTIITLLQKYKVVKSPDLKVPMPIGKTGLYKAAEPILVKLESRT